jgi:hypothetical protein
MEKGLDLSGDVVRWPLWAVYCPAPYWHRAYGTLRMSMPPAIRKLMLTSHLTSSVGWVGAVVAYIALGVSGVAAR